MSKSEGFDNLHGHKTMLQTRKRCCKVYHVLARTFGFWWYDVVVFGGMFGIGGIVLKKAVLWVQRHVKFTII